MTLQEESDGHLMGLPPFESWWMAEGEWGRWTHSLLASAFQV